MAENTDAVQSETIPKPARENLPSRRDFVRLLLAGGAAAALTACGITPEEQKDIPSVDLKELIAHPDMYANLPALKTTGYPEKTGKRIVSVPIFKAIKVGKTSMMQLQWATVEDDSYKLHEKADPNSPYVEFLVDGGMTFFPGMPLNPYGSHLALSDKYEVIGKISKIREADGKTEKYVFKQSHTITSPPKLIPTPAQTGT